MDNRRWKLHIQSPERSPLAGGGGILRFPLIAQKDFQTVVRYRLPGLMVRPRYRYVGALVGVYTFRSSDRPVGPTGLSDWSVRRSYRIRPVGQTVGRIKHV